MTDDNIISILRLVEGLPPHEFQSDQHFTADRLIHDIVADYDCGDDEVPHYTTSVDAALMTIPAGHSIAIETSAGGVLVYANVWDDARDYDGVPKCEQRLGSMALSITASALQARLQPRSEGGV